jgi:hypothetical protein
LVARYYSRLPEPKEALKKSLNTLTLEHRGFGHSLNGSAHGLFHLSDLQS